MARTIQSALKQMIEENVNMPSEGVKKSRASRDWLLERIESFETSTQHLYFCKNFNLHFGSFSRRTKVRPIDDIDIMIGLNGHLLYWNDNIYDYINCSIHLKQDVQDSGLWKDCLNEDKSLNSTKLLNKFKSALTNISHYENADIHRKQQAITLKLSSYKWNFDLVPCFHTTSGVYLIPNGNGGWMKTNPEKDQELVTSINKKHNGNFLELVRLVKYWNSKAFDRKANIKPSYLLEVMLANYYSSREDLYDIEFEFEFEFEQSLNYLRTGIWNIVNDPKNIEGNLNHLSYEEKINLTSRINNDLKNIEDAKKVSAEQSFEYWKKVLGNEFPNYGD
ncbi:SMODS domain-containing nucleotidyltransferase [Haemophilus haemolyticus]|uniref:SMODS domain-containing nucleotidyltransferase n=1 Tax=Haemophilus haemolyticus TaxID=726 RepID=UPI000E57DA2C|nr:hypothetical protein [Haemophilus haemolyticus]